jgi:Protein of unknown function (DUF4229)
VVKFTLGRVGLFVALALVFLAVPVRIDPLLKLMIALVVSVPLQFVVLRKWRTDMIAYVDQAASRRRTEKDKLRAALAGEDESST